jgi:RecA-family ATPase
MNAKPRHGLTEQAADAAVEQACRMLRLPTIRAQFPDLAEAAAREQMSYRGFLAELLMAECDDRARRRSERRIKAAGFPREKSLRTFDFDANPSVDPAVIHTLAACDWVKKGLPLCLIGDSGTGKSHLLIALGTEAAMGGSGSVTPWPPSSSTSWSRPPTTSSCPRPSPATAAWICSAWTSSATWNWTAAAPSCCSRF